MSEINDAATDAIEQLSSQYETSKDDLRERYLKYVDEEDEKGVSNPEKRALRRLALSEKGGQMQGAETMGGVVYGASDPINTSRSAINRAKEFIKNAGLEKAVKHGMIKKVPSGDISDDLASITATVEGEERVYAVIDSNSNSPTHGEVLPAEDFIRYVYGVVFKSPDADPKWFSGVLNADNYGDKPTVPPLNTSVKFKATWVGESDRNNTIRLRFQSAEPFAETEDGPEALELLESNEHIGHVSLDEANAENYQRNDIVATYGSVTYMELAPDGDQSRRLNVVDPFAFGSDLSRTVWLPDHVEVNFAEESDIFVIGQVSKSNNEYPDSIEAVGVLPHPDYVVERTFVDSMDSEETSESGEQEPESDDEASADGGMTPREAGAAMADPSEHVDLDNGDEDGDEDDQEADEASDGESADGDGEVKLTEAMERASYSDLQSVAAETDEVPGSGLNMMELIHALIDELGRDGLDAALKEDAEAADEADGAAEATTDGGQAGSTPEDNEDASEDDGEGVVPEEDKGDFEETEEDSEWQW